VYARREKEGEKRELEDGDRSNRNRSKEKESCTTLYEIMSGIKVLDPKDCCVVGTAIINERI
jgi:hypothetical protein